jgi:hypothetical protein
MTRRALRRPSFRETVEAAKRSNDFYADMAGKPRLDYSDTLKPKRASPVRNPNRVSENDVNDTIREFSAQREDLVLWRNNRGEVVLPSGQHMRYGVGPNGASDWIGYRVVVVTPSMVGCEIAQFVAVEAKAPDVPTIDDAQQRFIDRLNEHGAKAIVARGRWDLEKL